MPDGSRVRVLHRGLRGGWACFRFDDVGERRVEQDDVDVVRAVAAIRPMSASSADAPSMTSPSEIQTSDLGPSTSRSDSRTERSVRMELSTRSRISSAICAAWLRT
jgi:hypothetical protein